jgi:hypothetical protein
MIGQATLPAVLAMSALVVFDAATFLCKVSPGASLGAFVSIGGLSLGAGLMVGGASRCGPAAYAALK